MGDASRVADSSGDATPFGTVPCVWTCESVGDLVEQSLMHRVVVMKNREMSGERDAVLRKVTQPRTFLRMVEGKAPSIVEILLEELSSPFLDSVEIGHRGYSPTAARRRSLASIARRIVSSWASLAPDS